MEPVKEQEYKNQISRLEGELKAKKRELEIEASLEKVRSRAQAMQNSEEVGEVIGAVFIELTKLDFVLTRCVIWIYDKETSGARWWMANGEDPSHPMNFYLQNHDADPYQGFLNAWKQRQLKYVYDLNGKTKEDWDDFLFNKTELSKLPPFVIEGMKAPDRVLLSASFNKYSAINVASLEPLSEEHFDILIRFAKVFEASYTRFNDLKKAEAQAKEAQIEAALEKVRSRSLAMHKTEELQEVVTVVAEKLKELGVVMDAGGLIICTFIPNSKDVVHWIASPDLSHSIPYYIPYFDQDLFNDAWKSKNEGEDFFSKTYTFETKNRFFKYCFEHTDYKNFPQEYKDWLLNNPTYALSASWQPNSAILLPSNTGILPTDSEKEIVKRFARVFEQAFIRFLDLQKAAEQAKEARIETALERVRAVAMAMKQSEELVSVSEVMYNELVSLGFTNIRNAQISIEDEAKESFVAYVHSNDEHTIGEAPYSSSALLLKAKQQLNTSDAFYQVEYTGKELEDWHNWRKNRGGTRSERELSANSLRWYLFAIGKGHMGISTFDAISVEQVEIVKRFKNVFELSYRRFDDLQIAEAQARESQIQLALERVRARTMAMQKSEELAETSALLFKQFIGLGFEPDRMSIGIVNEEKQILSLWFAGHEGSEPPNFYEVPLKENEVTAKAYEAWKQNKKSLVVDLSGDSLLRYFEFWKSLGLDADFGSIPDRMVLNFAFFSKGSMGFISGKPVSQSTIELLERFASVFDLTYTRFMDLKTAESNARESQIEAVLENVRARAMSMRKSDDLHGAVAAVFEGLGKLNLGVLRVGLSVLDKEKITGDIWVTSTDHGHAVQVSGDESFDIHPLLRGAFKAWLNQKDFYYILEGDDLTQYYEAVRNAQFRLPESQMLSSENSFKTQYCFVAVYSSGGLFAFRENDFPEEAKIIMRRFAAVIDLTYKRFLDLLKAEEQARLALTQSSLDRVRAEVASMRNSEDLQKIIPIIWQELNVLKVPFTRCGIFIMEESKGLIEFYLSTPSGNQLTSFQLRTDSSETVTEMVKAWRSGKVFTTEWTREQFMQWVQTAVDERKLKTPDEYLAGLPEGNIFLYFVPFKQGMLYVGTREPLSPENIDLVKKLAAAFSIAYSRYEDFKELERAKNEIELTLSDLKSTQTQLIQSEKMASLGELTAGIAHEIQNPLNFVNNFSEVNKELLEELKEEIDKGNIEEVKLIAKDLIDNEEKINHHGKRADAIVKGMLLHSRTSSGQKEPTDLNNLADEYLRLAFHGLRAKDKSFNAKFETDFDKNLGPIDLVPQDIGRVLVNLINNAFYAVNERRKQGVSTYEPFVRISTKKTDNKIELRIADNGAGIPKTVQDKIFQPFFTTKPAGQGTGLGLSLSYDIITKGHNGELKVQSNEGTGSTFIIQLPVK